MLMLDSAILCGLNASFLLHHKRNRNCCGIIALAKKNDLSENSTTQRHPIFPLKVASRFLAQSRLQAASLQPASQDASHHGRLGFHQGNHHYHFHSNRSVDGIRVLAAKTIAEQEALSRQHIHTWTPTSSTSIKSWAEFAEKVSGEWDGYGADFSKEGEPIELPDSVVPEAFREWEVKVFDWQTQCPTLAHPTHFQFSYKLIKLLPTVGCEADAATRYSLLQRNINNGSSGEALALAYQSSGCYVAVWWPAAPDMEGSDNRLLELEHCLVDPRDKESRVRIIQEVRLQFKQNCGQQNKMMRLERIKVFCEQWYGPFRNGDQLGGCAIRDSAFASTPSLQSSKISGVWHGLHHAFANFQCNSSHMGMNIQELVVMDEDDESVPRSCSRDGNSLTLLPKQLWCSSNREQGSGETCFQVGWLLKEGFAITSKCTFSPNANLKDISITRETTDLTIK